MQLDRKKILIIGAFTAIVIVMATLLYVVFFRSAPVEQELVLYQGRLVPLDQLPRNADGSLPTIIVDPETGLPTVADIVSGTSTPPITGGETGIQVNETAQGGYTQTELVSISEVGSLSGTSGSGVRFYDQDQGLFYRVDEQGQLELLSNTPFVNVQDVAWSPRANQAILEFPDGANIYYDFDSGKQVTLPRQMTEFEFSKDGAQIGYLWYSEIDTDDNWLGIARPDGSQIKFLEPIGDKGQYVQAEFSPDNTVTALYSEGTGLNSMDVFFIGRNDENFKSLPVYGRGFDGSFTPDGSKLLYSVYSSSTGDRPQLWLAAAGSNIGSNNRPVGLSTWIDKCTFDPNGTTAYCAVPSGLPEGAGLVREAAIGLPDSFYRIDLKTGATSLLAQPVGDKRSYSATTLSVSENGDSLYFVDEETNQLYSIQLK